MGQAITLVGSQINLYINNQLYKPVQAITYEVDYGEEGIWGIDSPWAQEVAGNRCMVKGNVKGLRIRQSGGLQGSNLRPLFTDLAASPYVSIRVQDRSTSEDIILIAQAKVSLESHIVSIKSSYKLNFDFIGQQALFALDRSD
jgi:hypothetical protein